MRLRRTSYVRWRAHLARDSIVEISKINTRRSVCFDARGKVGVLGACHESQRPGTR